MKSSTRLYIPLKPLNWDQTEPKGGGGTRLARVMGQGSGQHTFVTFDEHFEIAASRLMVIRSLNTKSLEQQRNPTVTKTTYT